MEAMRAHQSSRRHSAAPLQMHQELGWPSKNEINSQKNLKKMLCVGPKPNLPLHDDCIN